MFCSKCGQEVPEQAAFCSKCGFNLRDDLVSQESLGDKTKKKGLKRIVVLVVVAFVIMLIGAIAFGFYSLPANRYNRQLKLGSKYLEENNYEQAAIHFSEAIEIEPKEPEAYLLLADTYIEQEKYEEALDTLNTGSFLTDSTEIEEKIDYVNEEIEAIEKQETERIEQERIKAENAAAEEAEAVRLEEEQKRIKAEEEAEAARIAEAQAELNSFPYEAYEQGYDPGMIFPDFVMSDVNGNPLHLSDYRGKTLYLNLFTTWCPYCFYEIPDMQTVAEQYGDDVVVVLVDLAETVELATQYAKDYNITFPINHIDDWIIGSHVVEGVPESFVLNKYGVIVDHQIGMADYNWMDSAVSRAIQD